MEWIYLQTGEDSLQNYESMLYAAKTKPATVATGNLQQVVEITNKKTGELLASFDPDTNPVVTFTYKLVPKK